MKRSSGGEAGRDSKQGMLELWTCDQCGCARTGSHEWHRWYEGEEPRWACHPCFTDWAMRAAAAAAAPAAAGAAAAAAAPPVYVAPAVPAAPWPVADATDVPVPDSDDDDL